MKLFPSLSSVVEFIYFQSDFCCRNISFFFLCFIVLLEMTFLMASVYRNSNNVVRYFRNLETCDITVQ